MNCYCYARSSLIELLHIEKPKTVWLADITCIEVVDTILDNGFKISYYITVNGSPFFSEDFYANLERMDVLILTHHYGYIHNVDFLPEGLSIIHDYTQSMFSYTQIRSLNGIYFSSVRKYTGTKYGSLSSLDSNLVKNNNSIIRDLVSILKMFVLEFDAIKYYYNYYQGKKINSKASEVPSVTCSDFLLKVILRYKTRSIRFKKSVITNYLCTKKINILNRNANSYFGVIKNDKRNLNLKKLGFNLYHWPDIGEVSHLNAKRHRQNFLFINYDAPWTLIILIYLKIAK